MSESFEDVIRTIQGYLQDKPLIILGFGASVPYDLPTMSDLASYIVRKCNGISDGNIPNLCKSLSHGEDLESAIYDRVVEYAADLLNISVSTGFVVTYIKSFELESQGLEKRRLIERERFINLLKVHGSIDWFINGDQVKRALPYVW